MKTPADAIRMFETTGVDGVMIGRAALHNPFIFRDIHAHVNGVPIIGNEVERRIDAMQRYLSKIDGAPQLDKWKLHKARTVIGWFSKGIPHGKDIRLGLQDMTVRRRRAAAARRGARVASSQTRYSPRNAVPRAHRSGVRALRHRARHESRALRPLRLDGR